MTQTIKNHIGLDSFFVEREKLLNFYDQAKMQTSDDQVKTEHGVVGEAEIRKWLESFLPKRFGVCKGYIITPNFEFQGNLEEWDLIIYDALESPILYTRSHSGQDPSESKRAIPVEYVRAVIEVKATFTPEMAKNAAKKLLKLQHYIGLNDTDFFNKPFMSSAIFLESKVDTLAEYRRALDNLAILSYSNPSVDFMGALVVRSQYSRNDSGYLRSLISKSEIKFPDAFEMSTPFQYTDGSYGCFGTLNWNVNHYSAFLFDLLATIKGTRTNLISSFYGFNIDSPSGSRLFPTERDKT